MRQVLYRSTLPSEDGAAAAPPAGEEVPAQPVVEPRVGGLMDPEYLAVDVGGALAFLLGILKCCSRWRSELVC